MAKEISKHDSCSICKTIPDRSEGFWKGGELLGSNIPKTASQLEIVGAPFFNDSTSYSHTCLKRCPKCGTYYDWSFSYEFLVNGTEDEIILTRITDREGEQREDYLLDEIKKRKAQFRSESKARVQTLINSPDKGIYGAAYFLHSGMLQGHDIAFAAPALAKAMIRVSTAENEDEYFDSCSSIIYLVLSDVVNSSLETAREVMDIFQSHPIATQNIERIKLLITRCTKILESTK